MYKNPAEGPTIGAGVPIMKKPFSVEAKGPTDRLVQRYLPVRA